MTIPVADLEIRELSGDNPIKLTLSGNLVAKVGASWTSTVGGKVATPLGSLRGYPVATCITYGETEMQFSFNEPYFYKDYIQTNAPLPYNTPEDLLEILELIQSRTRECSVRMGGFGRTGILREIKTEPTRGSASSGTYNLNVTLKWEWTGKTLGIPPNPSKTPSEMKESLISNAAALNGAINNAAFNPGLLNNLQGALSNFNASVTRLRNQLDAISSLSTAPIKTLQDMMATVKNCQKFGKDIDDMLTGIANQYSSIDQTLRSIFASNKSKGEASKAASLTLADLNDIANALLAAQVRVVGVKPGEPLEDVARRALGDPRRWIDIADRNGINGKFVPEATFQLTVGP